jgi:DUF1009 family protein
MAAHWAKLGIIAGGGDLPVALAQHCASTGADYFVARIAPFASPALDAHPGASHPLGAMGARMQALKDAKVDAVVVVGQVPRPDFSKLVLDEGGRAMMPLFLAAAAQGDDALLRSVLEAHKASGFAIVGAETVMDGLLAPAGVWGAHAPDKAAWADIALAAKAAAALGALDIGQGAIACNRLVLAVEAQEGTDRMLARVADLPEALRGTAARKCGVLVKRPKPTQDKRIDMPVVGVATIEGAARAGLAGIAVEAGGALAVRRDLIVAAADAAGLFVLGFTAADLGEA